MSDEPYEVIRDTREKDGRGWFFDESERCAGTTIRKLDTGDYSLVGYENTLCVERKGSVTEIARNVSSEWTRFTKEMKRMKKFKYKFLVLEFDLYDVIRFPMGTNIPPARRKSMQMNGAFILKRLHEITVNYGVSVVFVGKYGKHWASSLFKRVVENLDEETEE